MSLNTNFCSISVVHVSNSSIDICLAPKVASSSSSPAHLETHSKGSAKGIARGENEASEVAAQVDPLLSFTVDYEQLVKPIVIRISLKPSTSPPIATASTEYSLTESDSTDRPQVWCDEATVEEHHHCINPPALDTPRSNVQSWCDTQFFADVADALYGSWPGSPSHPRTSKADPVGFDSYRGTNFKLAATGFEGCSTETSET